MRKQKLGNASRCGHERGQGAAEQLRVAPVCVAPVSIVFALYVFSSHPLRSCSSLSLYRPLVLPLSLTPSLCLSLSLWYSGKAHVPSRPRVLRTYMHTRSRTADLSFPTPPASGRRPIGPYPAQKHRTAHDRACNESGVREKERKSARSGGTERGGEKRKNRSELKRGSRKIIRFPRILLTKIRTCVHACVPACLPACASCMRRFVRVHVRTSSLEIGRAHV